MTQHTDRKQEVRAEEPGEVREMPRAGWIEILSPATGIFGGLVGVVIHTVDVVM